MTIFVEIFIIILPIFLLVASGKISDYFGLLDLSSSKKINRFLFYIGLPALLIHKISVAKFEIGDLLYPIVIMYIATVFIFLSFIGFMKWRKSSNINTYVGAHAAFRSNLAFVGLAVLFFTAGDHSVSVGAIIISFVVPLYNILGVICLLLGSNKERKSERSLLFEVTLGVLKNPLVWACFIGGFLNFFQIKLWAPIEKWIVLLGSLAMSFSLIALGVQLKVVFPIERIKRVIVPVFFKMILSPAIGLLVTCSLLPLSGENILAVVVMLGCPTAVVSFVMAEEMGADSEFASDLVLITTLFSLLTIPALITYLRYFEIWLPGSGL